MSNRDVSYTAIKVIHSQLAGENFSYSSKPGLSNWEGISPTARLIAEHVKLTPDDSVFIYGAERGVFAVPLAQRIDRGEIRLTDSNLVEIQMAEHTFELNNIKNVQITQNIDIEETELNKYQKIIIRLPQGRELARRWLLNGYECLDHGGVLYLAGPNNMGVQSAIKDAHELFGNSKILGYKKGNRIAAFSKTTPDIPPTWATEPGIAPKSWFKFSTIWNQSRHIFYSLPGIFSYTRVDDGTRLLLDHLQVEPGMEVLDLGCGYGIIGIIATTAGADNVAFVDSNLYAVDAVTKNLAMKNIKGAKVYPSDVLGALPSKEFDLILSNPPFHSGKDVNYHIAEAFIEQSYSALNPGGKILFVANQFIQYDRIVRKYFSNVASPARNQRYHLLSATK